MTDTIKVLGQTSPPATTLSTLYTVPAATNAVVSSLTICNHNATRIAARVSVAVGGAADAPAQYVLRDLSLLAHATFIATLGISLAPGDVVRVYADDTDVSFNLFGVEIT